MRLIVECDCDTATLVRSNDDGNVDERVECSHCDSVFSVTVTQLS